MQRRFRIFWFERVLAPGRRSAKPEHGKDESPVAEIRPIIDVLTEGMSQMQDEQPRPLQPDELAERIQPRPALTDPPVVPLDIGITVAAAGTPRAEVAAVDGVPDRLRVEVQGAAVGVRVFPPPIPAVEVTEAERTAADQGAVAETEGYLPDHLALRTSPEPLPAELQVPRRIEAATLTIDDLPPGVELATAVFAPDLAGGTETLDPEWSRTRVARFPPTTRRVAAVTWSSASPEP
jgi:hypothetical protein